MAEAAPRWRRRKAQRPDEILAAALVVFSEHGYAATRLTQVAQAAGVSKATLYLYFRDKADLFKAVVRSALIPNIAEAENLIAGARGSTVDLLARLLSHLGRVMLGTPVSAIPKLVLSEAGNFPEIAGFYHEEVVLRGQRLLGSLLARGVRRGELRAVDPEYCWRIVIAPLVLGVLWKHAFQPHHASPLDLERYLKAHLDVVLHGLAAEGAGR